MPISATAELLFIYFGKICRPDSDTTVLQVDADYIKKYNKTYVMYQYLQIYYRAISTWTALKALQLDVWEPVTRVWEPGTRVRELASRVRELMRDVWELSSHQLPLNLTPGSPSDLRYKITPHSDILAKVPRGGVLRPQRLERES